MEASRIDNDFGFHPATPVTGPMHDEVRLLCRTLAHDLNELLPEGRHKSLAFTKLEEVMQRANAAIACDTPPHPDVICRYGHTRKDHDEAKACVRPGISERI